MGVKKGAKICIFSRVTPFTGAPYGGKIGVCGLFLATVDFAKNSYRRAFMSNRLKKGDRLTKIATGEVFTFDHYTYINPPQGGKPAKAAVLKSEAGPFYVRVTKWTEKFVRYMPMTLAMAVQSATA